MANSPMVLAPAPVKKWRLCPRCLPALKKHPKFLLSVSLCGRRRFVTEQMLKTEKRCNMRAKNLFIHRRKDLYSAERQLVISDELGQLSEKQKIQVRRRRSREEVERLEIEFEASGLLPYGILPEA